MSRNQQEFRTACFVADCLRYGARPEVLWTHFPAGEHRTEITGSRLKRMGLHRGWPDYMFIWPARWGSMQLPYAMTGFLELKSDKGRLSPEQESFRDAVVGLKCAYAVARTGQEAIEILSAWGILERVKVAA